MKAKLIENFNNKLKEIKLNLERMLMLERIKQQPKKASVKHNEI